LKEYVKVSSFGLAKGNELVSDDSYIVKIFDDIVVGIVCDGVGSAEAGKEAASKTVNYLISNFKNRPKSWGIEKALRTFIKNINSILYTESLIEYERAEYLTTLSIVVIEGDRLYGANVGDSPIFLLRDNKLEQLSFSHNSEEGNHILTQAIGMEKEVGAYFFENFIKVRDKILICSDGLTAVFNNNELIEKLKFDAVSLVKLASKKVKDDLIDDTSAVVIEIKEIDKKAKLKKLNLEIPYTLKKGEIIDGYKLIKPLIQNNRTWLVEKKGINYVMKFPVVEAIEDKKILDLFIQEAWNAKRLKAGFFPKAVIPKNRTKRYYIMEYIEGESLDKRISKKPLPVEQTINLAKFLLSVSSYLLKFDLVHGDIKPQNIIITKRRGKEVYKIVDFGSIVEIFSIANKAGTPSFLSPERFLGEPISQTSEIFAIGVTLYLSLTKTYPYGEIEPFQNPTFKKPKRIKEFNKNVPDWLESVILRAIERDKNQRYQHYSEMIYDLNNPLKVKPYFDKNTPLIEREPIKFYKIAFFISFIINIILIYFILS